MRQRQSASQRILPGNRASGFTLLELLVAMTVVSLLTTAILFGWRIAAGSWGRVNELVDEQRRIQSVHELLDQQIANMVPIAPWLREGNSSVFFQGERDTARFVSRYSLLHRGRSGLYRVEYHVAQGEDGFQRILLNEAPMHDLASVGSLLRSVEQSAGGRILRFAPFSQRQETRVLLSGLAECFFEYLRPAGAEPASWTSDWADRGSELPRAMAVRIDARPAGNELHAVSVVASIANYAGRAQ
jgi:general secretion pathway protein J